MEEAGFPVRIPTLVLAFLLGAVLSGVAQGEFEVLSGTKLEQATPRDFYLEGSVVRLEKRNAVLMETSSGARMLVALVITSGFASQFQHKYSGILISETALSVCSNPLKVGSYGFGLHRPALPSTGDAEFILYNQAGQRIWECAAKKDLRLKQPRPLQALRQTPHSARIYFGRYWVEVR